MIRNQQRYSRLGRGKSKAHVVRNPGARAVAQQRFEYGANLLQIIRPRGTAKRLKRALRRRFSRR